MPWRITLPRALRGSSRAEGEVLGRSLVLRIPAVVLLLLLALDFASSAQGPGATPGAGFHVNQALILLGLYGPVVTAISGACLGGAEWEWGTRGWRQVVDGRDVLWSARVLVLAALALSTVVVGVALGGFLDLASGFEGYAAADLAIRTGLVWGVGWFWGLAGLLVAMLLRSFAWAAVVPVAWIVLEPLAGFYLPHGIAQVLPMWNIKIVLHALFPNRDGALAVILPASGNGVVSAFVVAAYLAGVLALSFLARLRREH